MDQRAEVAHFLRTRRDRIAPEEVGLIGGGRRRVPGLRRSEVAVLAHVGVEYYARMERGDLSGVSPRVLHSLAQALRLDDADAARLHDFARTATPAVRRRAAPRARAVRPSLHHLLNAITGTPALVRDRRTTIVAANSLARALYAPILDDDENCANTARFTFLTPEAEVFFPDWERVADEVVATLRRHAGQSPRDAALTGLIGELVTRSDEFRLRWGRPDLLAPRLVSMRIRHPLVGDLRVAENAVDLPTDPNRVLVAYTADPSGSTAERLHLLGCLTADVH